MDRDRIPHRVRRVIHRVLRRVDPGQRRPDPDYLFIVSYGRSGSTLLQGVLNSIPGYLIRGENRQAMRHLWAFHSTAVSERRRQRRAQERRGVGPGSHTETNAFFGIDDFPIDRSLAGIRRLALETLLRPGRGTRVVGFKEIRWGTDDVADYVDWLRKVFPGARFIVNTRDLDDVSRSKWWAENPSALDDLAVVEARLLETCAALGEAGFHLRYDDYAGDPAGLKSLFAWLGEDYDAERLRAVLGTRHSY